MNSYEKWYAVLRCPSADKLLHLVQPTAGQLRGLQLVAAWLECFLLRSFLSLMISPSCSCADCSCHKHITNTSFIGQTDRQQCATIHSRSYQLQLHWQHDTHIIHHTDLTDNQHLTVEGLT